MSWDKTIASICLWIVLCVSFLLSCGRGIAFRQELLDADQLMESMPDSSLALLKGIESPEKMNNEQYAYYCLLLTEARDKCYVTHPSDSLISHAVDYYEKQNDPTLKAKSLYYLGRVNQELLQNEKAINYYLMAIPFAEESRQARLLSLIYNHTGNLYRQQKMFDKALLMAEKSYEYCLIAGDETNAPYAIRDIGRVYSFMRQTDSAFVYYHRALDLAKSCDDKEAEVSILNDMSVAYEMADDYANALLMVQRAVELTDRESQDTNYLSLGSLYLQMNRTDSAAYYLHKAQQSHERFVKAGADYYLYRLSKSAADYRDALSHYENYQQVKDSTERSEQKQEILKLTHKFEQRELKREMELKTVRQRFIFSCCILFLLIVIAVVFFVYMRYRWSNERLLRLREKQIQFEKEMRLISEEQIKQNKEQIEVNRQKLISKEEALRTVQRDLLHYNTKLLKAENELIGLRREEHEFRNRLFEQTGLAERIRSAGVDLRKKDMIQPPFSAKHFTELVGALDEIYNNFSARLQEKYPQLKDRDLEICYLLKAKAKTGNIASIIAMTPNAVTKKKRQILDKMEIIDQEASLEEFLETF